MSLPGNAPRQRDVQQISAVVITLSMMDQIHGRPDETAGRNFRAAKAKERMVEGRHYFTLTQPDEIRRVGLGRADGSTPVSITLLTERGYLVLVKSFTDDLAMLCR